MLGSTQIIYQGGWLDILFLLTSLRFFPSGIKFSDDSYRCLHVPHQYSRSHKNWIGWNIPFFLWRLPSCNLVDLASLRTSNACLKHCHSQFMSVFVSVYLTRATKGTVFPHVEALRNAFKRFTVLIKVPISLWVMGQEVGWKRRTTINGLPVC